MLSKLLLALACTSAVSAVSAQTTYASPVRVTNTSIPVTGEVKVTGNTPVVNPTGVPMQVKAWDTIPVAQQGTVTVAPAGGQMTVTPNGGAMIVTPQGGSLNVVPAGGSMPVSGSVNLTGSPTVAISATGNEVKMATPRVFSVGYLGSLIAADGLAGEVDLPTLPNGDLVEIESVTGGCEPPGANNELPFNILYTVLPGSASQASNRLLVEYQGHSGHSNVDSFGFSSTAKIYASPGSTMRWRVSRRPATPQSVTCWIRIFGRVY